MVKRKKKLKFRKVKAKSRKIKKHSRKASNKNKKSKIRKIIRALLSRKKEKRR